MKYEHDKTQQPHGKLTFTARQRSCGKEMLLQASVILFTWEHAGSKGYAWLGGMRGQGSGLGVCMIWGVCVSRDVCSWRVYIARSMCG